MVASLKRYGTRETPKMRKGCLHTPSVYHAAVVIFLEFFAFGLLTAPMISVLDEAFPRHTFLMNGLIQGVKGFLSFLSAPLIGALSDVFGRKPFLLLTVTFTCSPIPFIKVSHWWYFTMVSFSGIFSVTFSVVLAFVSDITAVENRSWAFGLVSATFAASLIMSPGLGAYLEKAFSESFVITLACMVALTDILFIIFAVPESLERCSMPYGANPGLAICASCGGPRGACSGGCGGDDGGASDAMIDKRPCTSPPPLVPGVTEAMSAGAGNQPICVNATGQTVVEKKWALTWDKVDPFGALRHISKDRVTLLVCMTTFLSYLPEAGEYSCFFVYLRLVMGFSEENVALFIAICGFASCLAQTCGLAVLMSWVGPRHAITVGLALEALQLALFGLCSSRWALWSAGLVAGFGSITYPALSARLSNHVPPDQQGLTQGLLTGIRGLCGGLGPAVYGFIFYIFQVNLNVRPSNAGPIGDALGPIEGAAVEAAVEPLDPNSFQAQLQSLHQSFIPGPPFAFGAIMALLAIIVALFIPEESAGAGSSITTGGSGAAAASKSRCGDQSVNTENLLLLLKAEEELLSDTKDRRRRNRDIRHHQRQPSASKTAGHHYHHQVGGEGPTNPLAFLFPPGSAIKLTNPLRRILAARSHNSSAVNASAVAAVATAANAFEQQKRHEVEASDLVNIRVPARFSEAVIGGDGGGSDSSSEQTAPLLTSLGDASMYSSHYHSRASSSGRALL